MINVSATYVHVSRAKGARIKADERKGRDLKRQYGAMKRLDTGGKQT